MRAKAIPGAKGLRSGAGGASAAKAASQAPTVFPGFKGRDFALGVGEWLEDFTATFPEGTALNVLSAFDERLLRGQFDRSVWRGSFRYVANQVIEEGGLLRFNLEGMADCTLNTATNFELIEVLADEHWLAKTKFYVGAVNKTGAALEAALAVMAV
jgi:hypothetical protein